MYRALDMVLEILSAHSIRLVGIRVDSGEAILCCLGRVEGGEKDGMCYCSKRLWLSE